MTDALHDQRYPLHWPEGMSFYTLRRAVQRVAHNVDVECRCGATSTLTIPWAIYRFRKVSP